MSRSPPRALFLAMALLAPALAAAGLGDGGGGGGGAAGGAGPEGLVPGVVGIALQPVLSGLGGALLATHAGDGSGRMFVVQQHGVVREVEANGQLDPVAYLNVAGRISCCGERGLLGLAFAPDFADTGRLYISYTRAGDGASVLERLVVADPANGRPPASGEVLLVVAQPFSNHNGGHVAFGPDGMLYLGLGDGGAGGDPLNLAQNKQSLLGKMLRLDVAPATGYAIPPDNPFANGGGRAEIWALGLRNPWRWSFDRLNGDLWIADVGQNQWEEVNRAPRLSRGGENYGWRPWEGLHVFQSGAQAAGFTFPVLEYPHSQGCSVTGGYVYRGSAVPALTGTYLYGDFCSGRIWGATGAGYPQYPLALLPPALPPAPPLPTQVAQRLQSGGVYAANELADTTLLISSFGEDEAGEVYVVAISGTVHRIVAA